MNKKMIDMDEIIQKSLYSAASKIDLPPKEETWEHIVRELNHQRMLRKRNKFKTVAIAALVLFSSFLIVNPGNKASAVSRRLVAMYERVIGLENKTEMVSRQAPDPNQPPPPTNQASVEVTESSKPKVFKSIEEGRKGVPFTFQVPKYIPTDFSISNVTFYGNDTESGEVVLSYSSKTGEIAIFEHKVTGDFALSENVQIPETIATTGDINGIEGKLSSFKNGYNELEYYSQGLIIRVGGHITSEEIVKIGKSI